MNALNVLCAQLTRDLFAIAKFLFMSLMLILGPNSISMMCFESCLFWYL